ncbi:MAG TPA: DUF2207 domain-containing protein [Actinomycetota bacterium]
MAAPAAARRSLAVGALLVLAFAIGQPPADAKSYRFPEVRIEASVLHDGTIELQERRTFEFDGSFSTGFFTVEPAGTPYARAEGFRVEEDGVEIPTTVTTGAGGSLRAEWSFRAEDERRTFDISYRIRCAVLVYDDAAHLLWQFVGTGWEVPTDHVLVRVRLPGRATAAPERPVGCPEAVPEAPATAPLERGDVRAWGHGPLGGDVRLPDPQTVELEIRDLEPFTFVEGSILMPSEVVPAAPSYPGGPGRGRILAEERRLAREANELRERRSRDRSISFGMLAGVPLAFLALVLISKARDRVPGVPQHLEEPPEDLHPVELATLWDAAAGRYVSRNTYRTQLLHLARAGAIELEAVGRVTDPDDIVVRLKERPSSGMDEKFTSFLFPDSERTVKLGDLEARGKRRKRIAAWKDAVTGKTSAMVDRVRKEGPRWESILMLVVVGIGIWWWTKADLAGWTGLAVAGLAVLGWLVALRFMTPRLPPDLRERVARWGAFRRFLREFSSLPEAPALAVVIWERYLVYASALGVADEVERQVADLVPPEELPSPWGGAPRGLAGLDLVHSMRVATPLLAPSPPSPRGGSSFSSGVGSFSSSGGFGGGFSGGGGGGGGGTGGGAR